MESKRNASTFTEDANSNSGSWNNLPADILSEIVVRLHFRDRIQFRATCKSWQLAHCDQPASKLPWLLTHSWNWDKNGYILSICKYHDPSINQTFTNTHKIEDENLMDIFGASVCASKYGWLLLQRSCNTFLYSPYTKEIVKLPDLKITFNRSTFSTNPSSPDCVFFALQSSKSSRKLRVSICQKGDLEWKTYTFDGFLRVIEDVVYSNGGFYCVFSGGVLGVFTVENQEWRLLTTMEPITGILIRYRLQLVDSDGEILLVCPSARMHIFRFDWSSMRWVEQDRLGNKALFLGCTSLSILAEEETVDFAGKIYFHDMGCSYSLETRGYQLSDHYPQNISHGGERIWIEPPHF